ncbi:hypothetical protein OROHE_012433 [Orobanche hederae]
MGGMHTSRSKQTITGYISNVINKAEVGSVGITSCIGCRLLYELVLPMDGWRPGSENRC